MRGFRVSSVLWANEVVVVDTGSTDRTIEIAESLGARVVRTAPFKGFGEMRNRRLVVVVEMTARCKQLN